MTLNRIAIYGAGAWGTALANVAARAGRTVTLVARDDAAVAMIESRRESPRLPGIRLEEGVRVSAGGAAAAGQEAIFLAVPAQSLRAVVTSLAGVASGIAVIACAKGIEQRTRRFMTEIIAEEIPAARPAILSGPSFAADVARGLPTAVTLAAEDNVLAKLLAQTLGAPTFRVYHSTDVRGVEIGGAAKNVLAIAAGIVAGRKLGASAAAALTTRGFAELIRFGRAYGARAETLMGLSGLGDLILTCSTAQSRNFSLGIGLGQGRSLREAGGEGKLAEGVFTASALVAMAQEKDIEMPIAAAVAAVLDGTLSIDAAIEALLMRPFKAEGM